MELDPRSTATKLGIEFVDIAVEPQQRAPICFTFRWIDGDRWEAEDFIVEVDRTVESAPETTSQFNAAPA